MLPLIHYAPPARPLMDIWAWAEVSRPYYAAGCPPLVAHSTVHTGVEQITVSTVFLWRNVGFGFTDVPVLWETMIFDGPLDRWQWRYCSPEAATAGHVEALHELWATLTLKETPELVTVTTHGTWWRPLQRP